MKKMMLLVLLFPLVLHGMDGVFDVFRQESLLFELKSAIQTNDSTKKNECYKKICSRVIATQKINYGGSWEEFRFKCREDILGHIPISVCFNGEGIDTSCNYRFTNILDDCRKILDIQLTEIKSNFVKPAPKPSILCNNLIWAGCALASGFAYGVVYGYSTC